MAFGGRGSSMKEQFMFRESVFLAEFLEAALEKEKEKYGKCPVAQHRDADYTATQGWGFVVAGYFLVEQSFKAILHIQGGAKVPLTHSLSSLFSKLSDNNKSILREYYIDFKHTAENGMKAFPIGSLDDFLKRLDGSTKGQGVSHNKGSLDWRYFLIVENSSQNLPLVSVDYLHEIAYGCIWIIRCAALGQIDPTEHTHSKRERSERMKKYSDWLDVRNDSHEWDPSDERIEILYGPDGLGNYDLYHFKNGSVKFYVSKELEYSDIRIDDKTDEVIPLVSKKDLEI